MNIFNLKNGTHLLLISTLTLGIIMNTASAKDGKPTIVLVHGAFAESSSWNGVITKLFTKGYPVIAAANPMRGAKSDAAYIDGLLKSINGPIVLVGHSYGGSVITNAAHDNKNVKALVYVAGFAPDEGETPSELSGRYPGSTLGPTLAPAVILPDGSKELYIKQEKFHAQFAADVSSADAKLMAATQRPINEAAFNEPSGKPSWKHIPSWFIYGISDRNIPAKVADFMAKRAGAKEIVAVKGASHVVMISHPSVVAQIIEHAARAN